MIASRQASLTSLLRALLRARTFIEQNPGQGCRDSRRRLGVEARVAAAQMREHDHRIRLDQALVNTMSSQDPVRFKDGLRNPLDAIEVGLLREVASGAVFVAVSGVNP